MSDNRPCAEWCDRLELSPHELSSAEAAELTRHLETCAGCRRENERGLAIRAMLLASDPATELPAERSREMRSALMTRCETDIPEPVRRRLLWPMLLRWAALPVAAASALGVWALVHRPHGGAPPNPTTILPLVRIQPPAPASDKSHPRTAGDGIITHRQPRPPVPGTRVATGPSRHDHRRTVEVGTESSHLHPAQPASRLASHSARHRNTPRIIREILILEASADRGTAVEPSPPIRIAMGRGSSPSGQITMETTARRP